MEELEILAFTILQAASIENAGEEPDVDDLEK